MRVSPSHVIYEHKLNRDQAYGPVMTEGTGFSRQGHSSGSRTTGKSELRVVKYFRVYDMRTKNRIAC